MTYCPRCDLNSMVREGEVATCVKCGLIRIDVEGATIFNDNLTSEEIERFLRHEGKRRILGREFEVKNGVAIFIWRRGK